MQTNVLPKPISQINICIAENKIPNHIWMSRLDMEFCRHDHLYR